MEQTVEFWEQVATLPPGPELACALAAVPLSHVPNAWLPTMIRARSRQLNHDQAELFAGMVEISRAIPVDDLDGAEIGRAAHSFPWAGSEIAADLGLTPAAADREIGFAEHLIDHLPQVFAAMRAGLIDRSRAWVFTEFLDPAVLSAEQIATICDRLVPLAPDLTTRQLAGRLRRAVLTIDPKRRRRRYEGDLKRRGVAFYLNPHTGTATVAAHGLPPDEAAAAVARLDRLAETARRAGCPGTLGQISADLTLGMLDGRFAGLTEAQIINALKSNAQDLVREGVEVRISLSTLMGRDERPGEIAGVGPVDAEIARDIVERQHTGGSWMFAIIDDTGHLLHGDALKARPDRAGGTTTANGVVQIDITLAELTAFLDNPGDWAAVLAEIARSWADRDKPRSKKCRRDDRTRYFRGLVAAGIWLRDQNCVGPRCCRPARRSHLDHTEDHANGGKTIEANGGPLCFRHHPYKDRGWTLKQPEPGRFTWRSPLGQTYETRGEPLRHDVPEPQPADHDEELDTGPVVDFKIMWRPSTPRQQRPPPAEPEGPPPF